MRSLFTTAFFLLFCSISFSSPAGQPKTLGQLISQFRNNPGNAQTKDELLRFYNERRKAHEAALMQLSQEKTMGHWDKLIDELNEMQEEYKLITTSAEATELLNPVDYTYSLNNTKELAASSCYQRGIYLSKSSDKSYSHRMAALAFRKANEFVPGYRDAAKLASQVSMRAKVNVLITGIQCDSGYYKGGIYYGSESRFQDVLSHKLNEIMGNGNAKFFTQEEALAENETMDWVVYLNWADVGSRATSLSQGTRSYAQDAQVGTDAKGMPIMRTKYADVTTFERTVLTSGNLLFSIRDIHDGEEIAAGSIHTESESTQGSSEFSGDAGALGDQGRSYVDPNRKDPVSSPRDPDDSMISLNRVIFDPLKYKILSAMAF